MPEELQAMCEPYAPTLRDAIDRLAVIGQGGLPEPKQEIGQKVKQFRQLKRDWLEQQTKFAAADWAQMYRSDPASSSDPN